MMNRQSKETFASQAKNRVIIQEVKSIPDGEGGFTDTWVDLSETWAAINPIRADKRAQYQSLNVEATHLIKLRGGVTIEEKYRIVWRSRIFEVLTVEDIQERGFLKVCTCLERR